MPAIATPSAPPPAAPAKTAPAASNAIPPQPIENPVNLDADLDAEFAAMDDDNKGSAPAKPSQKPAGKPQPQKPKEKVADPEVKPEVEAEAEPEENPDNEGSTKADEQPEIDTTKPVKAADLRTAYQSLKKKVQEEHLPKIAKLESRIKELETKGPEESAPIIEELKTTKKQLEEAQAEMRFIRYEKSTEYLEKYDKPYKEAWVKAMKDLDELSIQTEDGGTRKATAQDMVTLANLPWGKLELWRGLCSGMPLMT